MRVVIDTNILMSAAITPGGIPDRIVEGMRDDAFQLCLSWDVFHELQEVLGRAKVRKAARIDEPRIGKFLQGIRQGALFFTPTKISGIVLRDPDDDYIVAAAVAAKADYIVSGDKDLLDLRECCGIPVISARQFADILGLRGDA